MSTLYHGSNLDVKPPRTDAGRRNLDFGRGFYVTSLKSQAEKWAVVGGRHNDEDEGIVNVYEFDDSSLETYNVLRFTVYEMGRITAEQALDQLRFKKPNQQLCIRNQEIIDKYLHFTRSYIIKGQD